MNIKSTLTKVFYTAVLMLLVVEAQVQPPIQPVTVHVTPSKINWKYKTGEEIVFEIQVTRWGHPIKGSMLSYEIGPEKMKPHLSGKLTQVDKPNKISAGKTQTPGFLRCVVTCEYDGVVYRGIGTAAVEPEKILAVTEMPADFTTFWSAAIEESRKNPLDAKITLIPEKSNVNLSVYEVSFRNGSIHNRIYGILCIPKGAGKFPAALQVPGAGVRAYEGDQNIASAGIITLRIGIHGIPVTMENLVYQNLSAGALSEYWLSKLDDKDRYYYKRVYLGCLRAIDFIYSLPEFDGHSLAVYGGSQGGALSIVTAALDNRVKLLYSFYPALCDLTGYLKGRAGGWPHMFANNNKFNIKPDKLATSAYYDVVNFARLLKIPGTYTFGYNDETCPPTSMYAAFNSITAPKEYLIYENSGHWLYPEQSKKIDSLLINQLLGEAKKIKTN